MKIIYEISIIVLFFIVLYSVSQTYKITTSNMENLEDLEDELEEIDKINQRLANKNFVEKAPAELIDQEKTNFNNLEKDVKKIQLTLENL